MKSLPYCHAWILTVFADKDSNEVSLHLTFLCDGSHQFVQNLDKSVTQEYLYMISLELLDNWKINLQLWRFSRLFEFFAVRTFRITVEAYIRLEFVEHLCLAALVFIYLSIFIHVHCSSSIVHGIYYTCIYLHYTLLHELCFLCNILCILCDMIYIYI